MISRAQDRGKQRPADGGSRTAGGRLAPEEGARMEVDDVGEGDRAGADEASPEPDSPDSPEAAASADDEEIPRLEGERLRACLEAILFASPEAVSRRRLYRLLHEADKAEIRDALLELEGDLRSTHRGYFLIEEAAGFRLLTRPEFAPFVARLRGEQRKVRLSAAAFETLAVIAYRQPVRRADLEAIRGVQCGPVAKNLMEWNLIRVVGQDDSPGRPLLYGTTEEFLELLGLSSLDNLPEPERLREQGEDRGIEVLDRIIEEAGGVPRVAEENTEEDAEENAEPVEQERSSSSEERPAPTERSEFDLDLDEEE